MGTVAWDLASLGRSDQLSRRLAVVELLAQRLCEEDDPRALCAFVYARLADELPIDACSIAIVGRETGDLSDILVVENDVDYAPTTMHGATRERQGAPGAGARARPGPELAGHGWQSSLACAMRAGGRTVGRIAIMARRPGAYLPEDARFLRTIADLLAGAFERHLLLHGTDRTAAAVRAQVRAMEQERRRLAEALAAISAGIGAGASSATLHAHILHQAALLIPFDEAAVTLLEAGTPITAAAIGTTLADALANVGSLAFWYSAASLDLATCAKEPRLRAAAGGLEMADLLSAPLLIDGTVVGRLTVGGRRPGQFGAHEAQIVALLAERAAQVVRITDLHAAQESALARIVQFDTLREQFVATVSHELRTPLTGILGYLELLISRWESLPDERRRRMLERTQSSAARLEHLVTDLLLFSTVEHHELRLHIGEHPVASLVERAAGDVATRFRDQRIDVQAPARDAVVLADPQRTIQVLVNLLDNAIKYSPPGTPVHVRWIVHRDTVEIAVRDHGSGIAAEDLPRLFVRFGTLGHQPRSGQAGTGIGLYLCKKLLDAMGGHIWATSRPGRGSTFRFTLPRR